ncbi:MAG: GGDEF domain-containing protein [Treponema sp.]|nr:GGDEF domain-containing protein [Treponema sp.]
MRIGLLIDYVVSEYAERMIKGVSLACQEKSVELVVFSMGRLQDLGGAFDYQNVAVSSFVSSKNLDGAIFISGTLMHALTKNEIATYIKSFKPLPLANISMEIPGIPSVVVDNESAYKAILEELVTRQKCRKFGILGARGNSSEVKNRIKNIKTILEGFGIGEEQVTVWKSTLSYGPALEDLKVIYKEQGVFNYDAIICMNDEMAFAAIDFCADVGLRVPQDVVILGFDNLLHSDSCNPTLSTIKQNFEGQGYLAGMNLIKEITGKPVDKLSIVKAIPVMRQSTRRVAYDKEAPHAKSFFYESDKRDEHFLRNTGTDWYRKKSEFYQTTKFYTEMQTDMTYDQLRGRINDDVRSFGITACAIVLYDKPIEMPTPFEYFHLPRSAHLYAGFDDKTGFDSRLEKKTIKCNPKEKMLPPGILQFGSDKMLVFAIYHSTLQYGYAIIRPGSYDVIVYDLFVKLLSSTIASVYSFSLAHNETSRVRAKIDELDLIASTDELTGVYNRRGFYSFGETTLKFAKAMGHSGMLIYCDMDGLKKINDTYGHEAGDKAILAESIILRGNFRSNDIIARIGGDEFAIICPGLTKAALRRIREQIDSDCQVWSGGNENGFQISISLGAVSYPSKKVGYKITPLLSEADSLMYLEKRRKKSMLKESQ